MKNQGKTTIPCMMEVLSIHLERPAISDSCVNFGGVVSMRCALHPANMHSRHPLEVQVQIPGDSFLMGDFVQHLKETIEVAEAIIAEDANE